MTLSTGLLDKELVVIIINRTLAPAAPGCPEGPGAPAGPAAPAGPGCPSAPLGPCLVMKKLYLRGFVAFFQLYYLVV